MDHVGDVYELPDAVTSRQRRDDLAERMLSLESVTRRSLPSRCFTVVRLDGKNFKSYTAGLVKPFDEGFADSMDTAALTLAREIQGVYGVYVVSDEVSLVTTDLTGELTEQPFGGVEAKLTSITASLVTVAFNADRDMRNPGLFDARVFTLPDEATVIDYLSYRQGDGIRNAISMQARHLYGKREAQSIGVRTLLERMAADGHPLPARHALGRFVEREPFTKTVVFTHKRTGEVKETTVESSKFVVKPAPLYATLGQDITA